MTTTAQRFAPFLTLLFVLLGAPAVLAQDEPEPEAAERQAEPADVFEDVISVLEVEVPVQVLRRGEPVPGLTADNFEIYDRGERREIVAFEVIDLSGPAIERSAESTEDRTGDDWSDWAGRPLAAPSQVSERYFLAMFDLALSPRPYLARAVDSVRVMLDEQLHPSDRFGVALLGSFGAQLVLGFTDDRELGQLALDYVDAQLDSKKRRVQEAAERLAERQENTLRELSLAVGPTAAVVLGGPQESVTAQVGFAESDFSFLNELAAGGSGPAAEALAFLELGQTLAQSEKLSRMRQLNQSLEALATMLSGLPGQKHLLYFSEGLQGFASQVSGGSLSGPMDQAAGTGAGMAKSFAELVDTLRRSGWIIQSFELSGPGGSTDVDGLAYLANETGGELYQNYTRLEQATEKMIERTSLTYKLVFAAPDVVRNGRYHPIEVRLVGEDDRRTEVVARKGYHAPKREGQFNRFEQRLRDADRLFYAEDFADVEAALALLVEPGPEGDFRVWVVLDAPLGDLIDDPEAPDRLRFDVQGYAGRPGPRGRGVAVEDVFVELVKTNAARRGDELRESFTFVGELRVPPGEWEVRVRVRERRSEKELLLTRYVETPVASSRPRPVFSATTVARLAGSGFTVRESEVAVEEPLTFGVADRLLRPSALTRAGDVELLTLVWGDTPAGLRARARLLTEEGENAAELELGPTTSSEGEGWTILLAPTTLGVAPGRYTLEVEWSSSDERLTTTRQILEVLAADPETARDRREPEEKRGRAPALGR